MESGMSWASLLSQLIRGKDLSIEQSSWAMNQTMRGEASPVQLAAFLVALRAKGESVQEMQGLADTMMAHAVPISVPGRTIDIVGTGGDGQRTVNISTSAAIVVASLGIRVVKHGNRAATSASGAADVLEALGVNLSLDVPRVQELAEQIGITFLFAQTFHPSMKYAATARRELGVPTAFNVLGPLTNPARPQAGAIGCANAAMAPIMAGVYAARGVDELVFRGESDGLDEMAATGPVRVWEIAQGTVSEQVIDPVSDLGLDAITVDQLRGGDAKHNADVLLRMLEGEPGPVAQTVLLNASAGLVADGTMEGTRRTDGSLPDRLRAGYDIAATAIESGAASGLLQRWIAASQS